MDHSALHNPIRDQYELLPYPDKPLALSVLTEPDFVASHQIDEPFALMGHPLATTAELNILDAGCGTGWAALALAVANPGAKIVGIDLSPKSVELARQRFACQGMETASFHVLAIEDLPSLNRSFDYINCDQVLSFLPDPLQGLQAMRQVLKPGGILRANLHSQYQRATCFQGQAAFRLLGLLHEQTGDLEAAIATEIMDELKPHVNLRAQTWQFMQDQPDAIKQCFLLRDLLVQGDKGFTLPELFRMLDTAGLEFVSMVNWPDWQLLSLFQDVENPPTYIAYAMESLSDREQLQLYELLNPVHRLLDFWCSVPQTIP